MFLHDAAGQAPEDAGLRQRYGLALAVAGDIRGALEQLEAAVRLDPTAAAAHLNVAVLYAQAGRTAEATVADKEELHLKPGSSQAEGWLRTLWSQ